MLGLPPWVKKTLYKPYQLEDVCEGGELIRIDCRGREGADVGKLLDGRVAIVDEEDSGLLAAGVG